MTSVCLSLILISIFAGTKGSHIRNIIKFSGSSVKISSAEEGEEGEEAEGEEAAGGGETQSSGPAAAAALAAGENLAGQRRVTILGAPEAQWKAQYLIFQKLREEGFAPGNEDIRLTVEILVPSSQVSQSALSLSLSLANLSSLFSRLVGLSVRAGRT